MGNNITDMTDRELLIALNEQVAALSRRLDENLEAMNGRLIRGRDHFERLDDVLADHDKRLSNLEIFRQAATWMAVAIGALVVGLLWAIFTGQAGVVFK